MERIKRLKDKGKLNQTNLKFERKNRLLLKSSFFQIQLEISAREISINLIGHCYSSADDGL